MMIFSLVAMIGLDKCCITSACLQWLCHSGERIVAHGPLVCVLSSAELAYRLCKGFMAWSTQWGHDMPVSLPNHTFTGEV